MSDDRSSRGQTSWAETLRRASVSGSVASVMSSAALAASAIAEGKGPLQPVNATSHWLHGSAAGSLRKADLSHTAVGYATHHAATLFWAAIFERWVAARPRTALGLLGCATAVSVLAVVVDYRATPKRFTPGWEFVLTKPSMGVAYGAMAAGLALGARLTPQSR